MTLQAYHSRAGTPRTLLRPDRGLRDGRRIRSPSWPTTAATATAARLVFNSTDGGRPSPRRSRRANSTRRRVDQRGRHPRRRDVAACSPGGTQVQAFSPTPSVPQTSYAQVSAYEGNTAITTYHGGVLVAEDNLTNTRVEYAARAAASTPPAPTRRSAAFNNEQVVAISGRRPAHRPGRLADRRRSAPPLQRHLVRAGLPRPASRRTTTTATSPCSTPAAGIHVFFIARRSGYDLMSETTVNGRSWSPLQSYSTAIRSSSLSPVLNGLRRRRGLRERRRRRSTPSRSSTPRSCTSRSAPRACAPGTRPPSPAARTTVASAQPRRHARGAQRRQVVPGEDDPWRGALHVQGLRHARPPIGPSWPGSPGTSSTATRTPSG